VFLLNIDVFSIIINTRIYWIRSVESSIS